MPLSSQSSEWQARISVCVPQAQCLLSLVLPSLMYPVASFCSSSRQASLWHLKHAMLLPTLGLVNTCSFLWSRMFQYSAIPHYPKYPSLANPTVLLRTLQGLGCGIFQLLRLETIHILGT